MQPREAGVEEDLPLASTPAAALLRHQPPAQEGAAEEEVIDLEPSQPALLFEDETVIPETPVSPDMPIKDFGDNAEDRATSDDRSSDSMGPSSGGFARALANSLEKDAAAVDSLDLKVADSLEKEDADDFDSCGSIVTETPSDDDR